MNDYRLRQLGPGDVEAMERLNAVFGAAFDEPETYRGAPPGDAYLERLLARDHVIALAAFHRDEVVGGLVAYVLDKFEQRRSEIYIYDLAVAEAHRRRGISTALIAELQRTGTARGAYVIFVQADHGDDQAIALYAGLGTCEDVLHFDIAVPPA